MPYEGYEKEIALFRSRVEQDSRISHLLGASPFTQLENADYDSCLTKELFRELFYLDEKLGSYQRNVRDMLDDGCENLALISGYKGCGKTIFVNYLTDYLKESERAGWRSTPRIFDFEKIPKEAEGGGPYEEESKFKGSLVRYVKEFVLCDEQDASGDFFQRQRNFERVFEGKRSSIQELDGSLDFVKFAESYCDLEGIPPTDVMQDLLMQIRKMSIKALFFAVCLCAFVQEMPQGNARFRRIFVFDNLDNVIDENKISAFIGAFVSFVSSDAQFFNKLRDLNIDGFDADDCAFFRNYAFIFCLRDTNVAKFSAHMNDRTIHYGFDISDSVPRDGIIQKRIDFLASCNLASNERLARQEELYRRLLDDTYVFERVYPLFNNNQRKVASVLQDTFVGQDSIGIATEYQHIMDYGNTASLSSARFGAHGLLARKLIDELNDQGYLTRIGAFDERISLPRIVLTQLYNKYSRHDSDGVSDGSKMALKDAWRSVEGLDGVSIESFANGVNEMFSLFEKSEWTHLLEIDSERKQSARDLEDELSQTSPAQEGKRSSLYITCAGRIFVSQISSHFEFFASHYARSSQPLFSGDNLVPDDAGRIPLCGLLQTVQDRVTNCASRVRRIDEAIAKTRYGGNMREYLNSDYLYRIPATSKNPVRGHQTYTERIISSHLGYVDAYRMFLLNLEKPGAPLEALDDASIQNFAANRDEIISALLNFERALILLLQKELPNGRGDKGHITESGRELYHMFKAAYLKAQNDTAKILHSTYPIGQLDCIRKEYRGMTSNERKKAFREVEHAELKDARDS